MVIKQRRSLVVQFEQTKHTDEGTPSPPQRRDRKPRLFAFEKRAIQWMRRMEDP